MNIKLNARLSAYSKTTAICCDSRSETVTDEQIDSLFSLDTLSHIQTVELKDPQDCVSFSDIDSLFN